MRNYFYKINKTYIDNFSKKVITRFKNMTIHNDFLFLKSLFREINDLFQFLGGMVSSKDNNLKINEYPDSSKFNKLITDISIDLNKLYTAQSIIEGDVNNLLNFNSLQRTKVFENLTSTQQDIYSLYIKNKNTIGDGIVIPSENPFTSSDNMDLDSSIDVTINQDRGSLTLKFSTLVEKPIDIKNINIYFATVIPSDKIYPNNRSLHLGSHWKLNTTDNHFIGDNPTDIQIYRTMMIDSVNNNFGIGWCEFEAVKTTIGSIQSNNQLLNETKLLDLNNGVFNSSYSSNGDAPDELIIKNNIAKIFTKDAETIYFDVPNSLQGEYITNDSTKLFPLNPQYKLTIPFNPEVSFTNEINIDFEPDDLGFFPKIVWSESKVYSNQNGSDISYSLLPPSSSNEVTDNGEYRCIIKDGYIKPTKLDLILEYGSDYLHWVPIGFMMSYYVYNAQLNYFLEQPGTNERISLILSKDYDVFVDSEFDQKREQSRAINVLLARGR